VWPRLEIFLKDALGIADGSKHRLLIGHNVISGQSTGGLIKVGLGCLHSVQIDCATQPFAGSSLTPSALTGDRNADRRVALHEPKGWAGWETSAKFQKKQGAAGITTAAPYVAG
jgi:hypothetical protein